VEFAIKESVFSAFKEVIEGPERASISEQTSLSTLNLRPQKLMKITKQLADTYKVPVDFYNVAKCRTLKDVMTYLGEQSRVA
jgi:hypothetical protein